MDSSDPSLPWVWIIEYLSSFPQIDTSIIRGLIETAPILPDGLGKNASEMVALRCLEELFGPKYCPTNVAPPDSRIAFDLSLSCKDVLEQILQDVPLSNLKKAGPELLRWDVQPFIIHKRASLPKCALEQLKDSILDGISVLDGDENVPTFRFDDSDDENGNQEGNLIPQIHESDNEVLQDGLLERNLLPSKRYRHDLVAGNSVRPVSVKRDGMHNDLQLNTKKLKQYATPTCTINSVEHIPICLHGEEQLEVEYRMTVKVTEIEVNNLGKDIKEGKGDQDVCVASRTLGQSDAVGHVELQDNQMENVHNADADVMMVEHKYGDRPCQSVVMDESSYVENGALQKVPNRDAAKNIDQDFPLSSPNSTSADRLPQNIDPHKANTDTEHPCAEQICEYEDDRFNIALKKSLFLGSKCTPSQGPVGKAGWTEQNFCVKCNQNGQVLVCGSTGCPLIVHGKCLDSAARFDDKGNFYCPSCAYSFSISKYLEAEDKTSLARKELAAFMQLFSKKLTLERRKHQSLSRLNGAEDLVGIQDIGHLGERDIMKEAVEAKITVPPQKNVCALNSDGEESSTDTNDEFCKRETSFSFPPTPPLRRKNVPWTNDEEEMLRNGAEKFAKYGGTVPWKRILDLGAKVFMSSRATVDLKEKWRNMCKGSLKCK